MRGPELIAAAIVVGCGMIAVAHYLGLRAAPAESAAPGAAVGASPGGPPPGAEARVGSPAAPVTAAPGGAPAPGPPPSSAQAVDPDVASLTEALRRAVAEAKPALKKACWEPALASEPLPDKASYIYSIGVDAEGHIQRLELHLSAARRASTWSPVCKLTRSSSRSPRPGGR